MFLMTFNDPKNPPAQSLARQALSIRLDVFCGLECSQNHRASFLQYNLRIEASLHLAEQSPIRVTLDRTRSQLAKHVRGKLSVQCGHGDLRQ